MKAEQKKTLEQMEDHLLDSFYHIRYLVKHAEEEKVEGDPFLVQISKEGLRDDLKMLKAYIDHYLQYPD